MKCPKCGYCPPIGRPRDLDYKRVRSLYKAGRTLREIADFFGVTHGAVAYALKKGKKK